MTNIFTYGSLMFQEVWERVVLGKYKSINTVTKNIVRRKIIGDSYPVAFFCEEDVELEGVVYLNISAADLERLDIFEGEYYQRQSIKVTDSSGKLYPADIFLLDDRYRKLASSQAWSPEAFYEETMDRFIKNYVAENT